MRVPEFVVMNTRTTIRAVEFDGSDSFVALAQTTTSYAGGIKSL